LFKPNQCNALKHEAFPEIMANKWECVSRSEKEHETKGAMVLHLCKNFLKSFLIFWFVLHQGKMNKKRIALGMPVKILLALPRD